MFVRTYLRMYVCKRTLNKRSFYCTKCDLKAHKKCSNTVFFGSDICSDCKRWENLPLHVSFSIGNSNDTESSLIEDNLPSIPSHNEAWKVFKVSEYLFLHEIKKYYFFSHKTIEKPYLNLHFKFHDFFP